MDRVKDPAERTEAEDFVALLTPVVKALFTDLGLETTNLALQTYGGHGYVVDHGMEQLVRDVRIALIYEGTNGVQALDLVGRKMPANLGRSLRRFFHPVAAFIESHNEDPDIGALVAPFAKAFGALQLATGFIAQKSLNDPEEAGAASADYLRMFGLVALGFMWVRMAKVAADKQPGAAGEDAAFYKAKRATATFFIERILPQVGGLLYAIKAGKASMMALEEAAF
jgi:hypothetical protein